MIRLAVGFGRGFPRIWLLPIGALIVTFGVAVSGRLSRAIAADFLAWWPVWFGIGVAAYLLREKKLGPLRVAGLVPLVALLFVGLFLWGHLAGWVVMPSAAQRLIGPETTGFTEAALEARVDGAMEIRTGSEHLYRVEPMRAGGGVGIPGAREQIVDSAVSVVLQPPADPGIYTYAGWNLTLAEDPRWSLSLDGAIDADLGGILMGELELAGSGVVRLGMPEVETPVSVEGAYTLVVPEDVPARVIGVASVPASWSPDSRGATAPTRGEGWVIRVASGSDVTVSER